MTPVRAIRQKCLECAGSSRAATRCEKEDCPLYPYRTGRNPARAGIGPSNPHKDAHSGKFRPSQVGVSADKKLPLQGSTPEINLGHPRAKNREVNLSAMAPGSDGGS